MKIIRFIFFFIVTIALFVILNTPFGETPPIGKLLSPHQGFWQNSEKEALPLPESMRFKGLNTEVEIQFDELYIPHIYAQNLEDLYFASGYITAYHRLWQMDFYSRLVLGRLSEVVGKRALDFDRRNRRIGLKQMTYDFHETIMQDEKLKKVIEAYTAGINAHIDKMSPADYPIEFKLLNYKPERWTTIKSCMAYAMLASDLSQGEADLENTNIVALFGKEMFDLLFPEQLGNLDPIYPKESEWNFEPITVEKPEVEYPILSSKNTIDKPDRIFGSNNFAVSSEKSKSGNPLLANEPDLRLTQPSIWYALHLNAPDVNVMGVTVPGTAPILIGFNDSISWGVTNSPRDQVDWYSIEFKDESRNEYKYNGQWFKTETLIEKFEISDAPDFYDTIVYVHHGPVVYDRNFKGNGEMVNYAMRWMAHKNNTTFKAMFGLNFSKNLDDFNQALKYFTGPPQNFVFASVHGNIAMRSPGKFPVKWEEQGKFLMDGSDPAFEWKDLIPFEHQMYIKNPERGFVSSANQHQVDESYPYWVYDYNFEFYRNRRINDRLRTLTSVTPQDMMTLQNDNFNYRASELLPVMLDSLDTTIFQNTEWEYFNSLKEWDYFNGPERVAPIYFRIWWEKLYKMTWDEFDTISLDIIKPEGYTTIYLLKNQPDFVLFDRLDTDSVENAKDLFENSFTLMIDSISQWKEKNPNLKLNWYSFKNTRVNHLVGLEPFSRERVKIGGYGGIVNAAGKTAGPSWRMVVELDKSQVKAWGIYPGSQSGNPGNPMYGHMIDDWAAGEYYPLKFRNGKLTEGVTHTLTLKKK